jgi:hypothetical protein
MNKQAGRSGESHFRAGQADFVVRVARLPELDKDVRPVEAGDSHLPHQTGLELVDQRLQTVDVKSTETFVML